MKRKRVEPAASQILPTADASLLDVVDNLLARGVVLNGEVILALAEVDLIYLRLSLLFCAADRVLPAIGEESRRHWRRRR